MMSSTVAETVLTAAGEAGPTSGRRPVAALGELAQHCNGHQHDRDESGRLREFRRPPDGGRHEQNHCYGEE